MARTLSGATITGVGKYLPEKVLTNKDLEKIVETNDDWIFERTGIRQRYVAAPDQAASDLAVPASVQALERARVVPEQVDLILVATCTGDNNAFPATAAILQDKLGATNAAAFDVSAVCAGWAYALDVAAQYVYTGRYKTVLVVGTEIMSRIVNWQDRTTCVLFGDGAGATVVQAGPSDEGILGGILGANGAGAKHLNIPAGGSRLPLTPELMAAGQNCIYQNGREVYKFAVEIIGEAAMQALDSVGLSPSDVDLFIPHQANIRIMQSAAKRMDLPFEKLYTNVECYGNTSAASVPLALCEAWEAGRIKPGDLVVTVGFGAGLSWGANVIRWGNVTP